MFKKLEFFIEKKILGSKINPLTSKRMVVIPVVIIFMFFTFVFFFFALPDYVDCQGYFEPADFYKVYSESGGTIIRNKLTDGGVVKKGDEILKIDSTIEEVELDAIEKKYITMLNEMEIINELYANLSILYKEKLKYINKSINNANKLFDTRNIPEIEYYERLNSLNYDLFTIETDYNGVIKQKKNKEYDIASNRLEREKILNKIRKKVKYSPVNGKIIINSFYSEKYGDINLSSAKVFNGRSVVEGELLAYIAANEKYKAVALIPEIYIARVNPGQETVLYLSSFSVIKGKITTGKLVDVNNSAVKGVFLGFIELNDESLLVIKKKTKASLIGSTVGIKIKTRKRTLYEKLFNLN